MCIECLKEAIKKWTKDGLVDAPEWVLRPNGHADFCKLSVNDQVLWKTVIEPAAKKDLAEQRLITAGEE